MIISTEGLTVTLSVANDLGDFIPNARLETNLTFLLRKLIERIEQRGSAPNPAGDRILGLSQPSGETGSVELNELGLVGLNHEQEQALASAVNRDTTFIWGPPGTGKTRTIGAVGEALFARKRSLLLVSHTNTAVDGAMLQIADRMGEKAHDGTVIRVGIPSDEELKTRPDLLLSTHVERRSADAISRIASLEEEQATKRYEHQVVQRLIAITQRVKEAAAHMTRAVGELANLRDLEVRATASRVEYERILAEAAVWKSLNDECLAIARVAADALRLRGLLPSLDAKDSELAETVVRLRTALPEAEHVLKCAEYVEPLREQRAVLPSSDSQTALLRRASEAAVCAQARVDELGPLLPRAEKLWEEASAASKLVRVLKRLPAPEEQRKVISRLQVELSIAESSAATLKSQASEATTILTKIQQLDGMIAKYSGVASVREQKTAIVCLNNELATVAKEHAAIMRERDVAQNRLLDAVQQVETFETKHNARLDDLLTECRARGQHLAESKRRSDVEAEAASVYRETLETFLRDQIRILADLGLADNLASTAEAMVDSLRNAQLKAAHEIANTDLDRLSQQSEALERRIKELTVEITDLNEQLKRIEEVIISEARIVATTLTRAYLRDTLQARRFDTVLLDEASMAPIPALWSAAGLADRNVVAVGDFKQLPPIVQSSHELALKWLGTDVFDVAGIKSAYEQQTAPPHFVALREQHRMHPDIRAVADHLFYDDVLRDGKTVSDDAALNGWFRHDWGHDTPVLLVNTSSLGAWVTSVAKGVRTSRLNFLSATVCVDLAERLLAQTTPARRPRILIISPYSPHAKLLRLLIKSQGLEGCVEAGTVHTFQGSEAPIVILDLVNDEPHWRVGMFTPKSDDSNKRLLNVAITRAQRRLIIVGDFDYCQKLSKNAFLGRTFLPFLRSRHTMTNAMDIVPTGLLARGAQAQSLVFGGEVEATTDRVVVTQATFYTLFLSDISHARRRLVIYSPFITADRLAALELHFKAAVDRQVRVYVITKPRAERNKRDSASYQILENALVSWGATLIHKIGMHEKLVFVDDDVVWSGSLNPLSFSNTQEVMERRRSREVVSDFVATLQVEALVGAYDAGDDKCPICGNEMMPAEGANDPFYWRCAEEGCYSRSVGDPPLKEGAITCRRCGRAVEFGEWGGKPAWRCVDNRHHHQRLHRNHLRLPRMRALVPRSALRQLDRQLGSG